MTHPKPTEKDAAYWSDWLLDAVACATQDRRFLRGEPEYDENLGAAVLANGEKAIVNATAALRSEREEVAQGCARMAAENERMRADIEQAKCVLLEALVGERHDDSWMRPMRLSMDERARLYKMTVAYLDRALSQEPKP